MIMEDFRSNSNCKNVNEQHKVYRNTSKGLLHTHKFFSLLLPLCFVLVRITETRKLNFNCRFESILQSNNEVIHYFHLISLERIYTHYSSKLIFIIDKVRSLKRCFIFQNFRYFFLLLYFWFGVFECGTSKKNQRAQVKQNHCIIQCQVSTL